jgi:hypothetical protein
MAICSRCKKKSELFYIVISFPYGAIVPNGIDASINVCQSCAEEFYSLIKSFSKIGYMEDIEELKARYYNEKE